MIKTIFQILLSVSFPLMLGAQDLKQGDPIHELMIDTLNIGSSYEIIYHSQGCFHNYSDTVTISRDNKGFYICMGNNRMILERDILDKYKRFEYELLHESHIGGCTTVDEYILKTDTYEVLLLRDDSCKWGGFENFINLKE